MTSTPCSRSQSIPPRNVRDSPDRHPHHAAALGGRRLARVFQGLGIDYIVRPVAVGIVHGLAGSAAVALLVVTAIRDPKWAIAYLLVFGLGTIAGMVLITTAIAVPFAAAAHDQSAKTHGYIRVATGVLSVGFGLFLAYRIGMVDGLFFSGMPRWSPR